MAGQLMIFPTRPNITKLRSIWSSPHVADLNYGSPIPDQRVPDAVVHISGRYVRKIIRIPLGLRKWMTGWLRNIKNA